MDGLLLDSEDKYTICTEAVLAKYGKPCLPWSIKAKMQGRPSPTAGAIFQAWAQLPLSHEEYLEELVELQRQYFPTVKPLPGTEKLLGNLRGARSGKGEKVNVALATSSLGHTFVLKTGHLEEFMSVFPMQRRVLGDDVRIPKGRGKPSPDIYLLALKTVNDSLAPGEKEIRPEECLVFEDSVPGVESGRRAGMRVVWVPHLELKNEYKGKEKEVLAGKTGEGDGDLHQVGEIDDGWAEYLETLENFPYERYGIVV
jgi:pseudouridine 5'-phosphatase